MHNLFGHFLATYIAERKDIQPLIMASVQPVECLTVPYGDCIKGFLVAVSIAMDVF